MRYGPINSSPKSVYKRSNASKGNLKRQISDRRREQLDQRRERLLQWLEELKKNKHEYPSHLAWYLQQVRRKDR